MIKLTRSFQYFLFVIIYTVIYGFIINSIEFSEIPTDTLFDKFVVFIQWCVVVVCALPLFVIITVNRYICAVLLPLLNVLSAIFAYLRLSLHIMPTPDLVDIILVNDIALGYDFINFPIVMWGIGGLSVGIVFAVYRWKYIDVSKQWLIFGLGVLSVVIIWSVSPSLKDSLSNRMPYSFYSSVRTYFENVKDSVVREPFNGKVINNEDSMIAVVVLGESLRADHMQINGYPRQTMPFLSADSSVVSINDLYSPESLTHKSLPIILTRGASYDDPKVRTEHSFISIFNDAGYSTSWISNQDAVSTYKDFIDESDRRVLVNAGKSIYVFSKWVDMALIPEVKKSLDERGEPLKLLMLHTIGSHWFYNSHYEEEVFTPVLKSKKVFKPGLVSENVYEELINSYDNTIVETDKFLHVLIGLLENEKAWLLYVSDHGESLGEDGRFLHGSSAEEVHHTGCFVWYSDKYKQAYPEKVEALKNNASKPHTTECIFHSVLDGSSLSTPVMDSDKSLFRR